MDIKKYWKFILIFLLVLVWMLVKNHRGGEDNILFVDEALVTTADKNLKIKFYKDIESKRLFVLSKKGKRVYVDELKISDERTPNKHH